MAKIADNLRLNSTEVNDLMVHEARIRIATIGPAEKINLTPMTFGWANGKVFIFGRGQKIANLRRNSTATVLLDIGDSWRELQGIMMHGVAKVLETIEAEELESDLPKAKLNLGEKSGLRNEGEIAPYEASASGRSRRWIVFEPMSIVSWNNQRLPLKGNV